MPRVKQPIKMGYLDIETTPHEGTFWNLFPKYIPINQLKRPTETLSWAFKWEGSREIIFRRWDDEDFIEKMHELLNEADAIVHYNGKSFDMKHLNREFIVRGLAPPSFYFQIDLLSEVRKNFKLASNKLDYVSRYFGLGTKVQHAGIELWYGCMEGNERDWKIMERYNKMDVKLLPKLYKYMLPWIKSHPNLGLAVQDPTSLVCPTCASQGRHKELDMEYRTSTRTYKQYECASCKSHFRERSQNKKASTFLTVRVK